MSERFTVRILTGSGAIDIPCASQEDAETVKRDALADGFSVTTPGSRIIDVPPSGRSYVIGGVDGWKRPEN